VNYRRRAQTTALRRKPRRHFDDQVVAVAVAVAVVVATAAVKSKRRPELKQINSDSPPKYGASF
jgi:NO-binding membrane sensor protein with MHYT domain